MDTQTKQNATLFGVPLMRIFWLFIYSVVLCLLVGVGVWYFAVKFLSNSDFSDRNSSIEKLPNTKSDTTSTQNLKLPQNFPTPTQGVGSEGGNPLEQATDDVKTLNQDELSELDNIMKSGDFEKLLSKTDSRREITCLDKLSDSDLYLEMYKQAGYKAFEICQNLDIGAKFYLYEAPEVYPIQDNPTKTKTEVIDALYKISEDTSYFRDDKIYEGSVLKYTNDRDAAIRLAISMKPNFGDVFPILYISYIGEGRAGELYPEN